MKTMMLTISIQAKNCDCVLNKLDFLQLKSNELSMADSFQDSSWSLEPTELFPNLSRCSKIIMLSILSQAWGAGPEEASTSTLKDCRKGKPTFCNLFHIHHNSAL